MDNALTMTEVARRLGVSRVKVRALVKEGVLPAMTNPLDKRERLIPVSAVEQLEARSRFVSAVGQPAVVQPPSGSSPLQTTGLDPSKLPGGQV